MLTKFSSVTVFVALLSLTGAAHADPTPEEMKAAAEQEKIAKEIYFPSCEEGGLEKGDACLNKRGKISTMVERTRFDTETETETTELDDSKTDRKSVV